MAMLRSSSKKDAAFALNAASFFVARVLSHQGTRFEKLSVRMVGTKTPPSPQGGVLRPHASHAPVRRRARDLCKFVVHGLSFLTNGGRRTSLANASSYQVYDILGQERLVKYR